MNKIYIVDTFSKFSPEDSLTDPNFPLDQRCVGWFETLEDAKKAVTENYGDIYECGYYPYAQIESSSPGFYGQNYDERWWFMWDKDIKQYVEIDIPPVCEHIDFCGVG